MRYGVTGRHVLPIAAALVLGLGAYLWFEVRRGPAPVVVPERDAPRVVAGAPSAPAASPAAASGPPSSSDRPDRAPRAAGSEPQVYIPPLPALEADRDMPKPKLDALMDQANKAYDRGDYEEAKTVAGRLLVTFPTNARMLRIIVSASCIDGDTAAAQASFAKLPPADQEQMKVRCARYGVTLGDKP
jgi:hypothetical protein